MNAAKVFDLVGLDAVAVPTESCPLGNLVTFFKRERCALFIHHGHGVRHVTIGIHSIVKDMCIVVFACGCGLCCFFLAL
jgi:hypothetical protein